MFVSPVFGYCTPGLYLCQGLALRRSTLAAIGGVPLLPLMEDYELAMRVRRVGKIATLPRAAGGVPFGGAGDKSGNAAAVARGSGGGTSARRFEARGALWRQCFANQLALVSFAASLATPEQISRWY